MYTPPSIEGTIVQPGIHGGNEWGGPAYDPETNTAFVNVNDFPFVLKLDLIKPDQIADDSDHGKTIYGAECAYCHGSNRGGGTGPRLSPMRLNGEELRHILQYGRGAMPAFPYFSEDKVDKLVSFLLSKHTLRHILFFHDPNHPVSYTHLTLPTILLV